MLTLDMLLTQSHVIFTSCSVLTVNCYYNILLRTCILQQWTVKNAGTFCKEALLSTANISSTGEGYVPKFCLGETKCFCFGTNLFCKNIVTTSGWENVSTYLKVGLKIYACCCSTMRGQLKYSGCSLMARRVGRQSNTC